MFSRPVLFIAVLLAAVVVPYVALNEQLSASARSQWQRVTNLVTPPPAEPSLDQKLLELVNTAATTHSQPAVAIEEAFHFEITKAWVAQRWSRISMVHGDLDHLGMRVAWVSGIQPDDVAGSLTYYFDQHHQLQRITFTGQAVEPRRLLAAVIPAFHLQSLPTTDAAHYVSGDRDDPTSEVLVKHLPTIRPGPNEPRVDVSIDLRRGDVLSPRAESPGDKPLLPSGYRRW